MNYHHSPQESVILARALELWRVGIPALAVQPTWAADGIVPTGAPANHALAPKGAKLYRGDVPAEVRPSYGVAYLRGDAVQVEELCAALWDVPVGIALALDRRHAAKVGDYLAELSALFTGDFTAAGGYPAAANWSTAALQVDHVFLERPSATRGDKGEAAVELEFTLRCRFPVV